MDQQMMKRIWIFGIGTIAIVVVAYIVGIPRGSLLLYLVLTWLIGSVVLFWKAKPTQRSGLVLALVIIGMAFVSLLIMAHGWLAPTGFVPFITAGWLVLAALVLYTGFGRTA